MPNINTNSGSEVMRKIQFGLETTPGTLVPATALWRGLGVPEDTSGIVYPKENIAIAPGATRAYFPLKSAKVTLAPIEETFEQGPYLFEMGAKKLAAPVADGAGSGKIYTYPFWTTPANKLTQPQLGIRTIEGGDDVHWERIEFGYADQITLDGKGAGAWMMSGVLMGRQVGIGPSMTAATIAFTNSHSITDSGNGFAAIFPAVYPFYIKVMGTVLNDGIYTVTATAAGALTVTENTVTEALGNTVTIIQFFSGGPIGLALPAVNNIPFGQSKLFIDPIGGTIGATQMNSLLAATLSIRTGIYAQPTANGTLLFDHLEFTPEDITLKMTFLMNGPAEIEKKNWQNLLPRLVRIQSTGPALTTPGTTYSFYTRNIDLAGLWDKFDPMGANQGVDQVSATFHAKYDPTAAKYCNITYVNQLAALP